MRTGEFTQYSEEGIEGLQGLGFERIASSDFVTGGGLLIEKQTGLQRLYVPFSRVNSERVEAIRMSETLGGTEYPRPCVQILQPSPEASGIHPVEKTFLEVSPAGYGGPLWTAASAIEELTALARMPLTQQLEDAGFVRETEPEGDARALFRFSSAKGDVVAILAEEQLQGLFVPIEQWDDRYIEGTETVKILGIAEAPGNSEDDLTYRGIRVSNSWAEFTISPGSPGRPAEARIIREPLPEELGVALLETVQEPGGFIQGGVNSTETIRGLLSINNVPVGTLNQSMRPGRLSAAGFLGEQEHILDVMARDNEIVRGYGLAHQQLAMPLRYIQQLYLRGMLRDTSLGDPAGYNEITLGGDPYKIGIVGWMGYQISPFRDGTTVSYDIDVLNLKTGHSLQASALIAEMVARYGFYEGQGTSYRVAPEEIVRVFSHLRPSLGNERNDPVVAITAGRTSAGTLTSLDQIERFRRLREAGVASIEEAHVAIHFSSSADMLAFLSNESNTPLLSMLAVDSLKGMDPAPLRLQDYQSLQTFTSALGQFDETVQYNIIAAISEIGASEQSPYSRVSLLREVLVASAREVEGVPVQLPTAALLEKVAHTPAEFLKAFYGAAGGSYSGWVTQKPDEPRGIRSIQVRLDEDRARALTDVFSAQILPHVETFREPLGIDASQPLAEQTIAFLKKYHFVDKAQEIAELVKNKRPDLTVSDWAGIIGVVERVEEDTLPHDMSEPDRNFLDSRQITVTDILDVRKMYPTGSAETVILQLYNGALKKFRGRPEL